MKNSGFGTEDSRFRIPFGEESNPDSNPMRFISKGFESGFESSPNGIQIRRIRIRIRIRTHAWLQVDNPSRIAHNSIYL